MTSRLSDDWSHSEQSARLERDVKAIELREALHRYPYEVHPEDAPIWRAARERLAQLEADPELVERIANYLRRIAGSDTRHHSDPVEWFFDDAKEILAALITTDEEA